MTNDDYVRAEYIAFMSERDIIKIAVSNDAKAAIEHICQRYGMSQVEMASRLYTWFAEQDEVLQTAILDILPAAVRPNVARLLLERLADESPGQPPASKAAGSPPAGPIKRGAKAARTNRRSIHKTTHLPGEPKPKSNPKSSGKSTHRRGRKRE